MTEGSNTLLPRPDPSVLTTEQMLLAVDNLEKLTEALQTGDNRVVEEKIHSIRREIGIYEAHRLELKGDSEKTLSTASIAAEKAVQAALAAAEKARDQQTIASQLATTKAEVASKEQMTQQAETSATAITALTSGLNDVKALLGELRAEKRGSQEQVVVSRDSAADMKPLTDAVISLVASQQQMVGKQQQVVEHRAGFAQTITLAALGASLFSGTLVLILSKLFG